MLLSTLFADAITFADATPIVGSIGSLGFAIWFAWYTTTTTLPNQAKDHRQAIEEITKTHADTIRELVSELRLAREAFDKWKTGH